MSPRENRCHVCRGTGTAHRRPKRRKSYNNPQPHEPDRHKPPGRRCKACKGTGRAR